MSQANKQGGFNERLDEILTKLARETTLADRAADIATTPQGVKDASKRYQWSISEARTGIRTLVLEEVIGENDLSYSIPQGMPESLYNCFKGADKLREEQRNKLEDSNGTK